MEDLVLNAVRHIRTISKKMPNYKSILSYIQKSAASNTDLPSVESICTDMIANGIIDKDLKILISTSSVSDAILDDIFDFGTSDKSNPESPQRASLRNQLNTPVIDNTPVISSQKTPNLSINTNQFGQIKENMNEIYELKKEMSLLRSLNDRN